MKKSMLTFGIALSALLAISCEKSCHECHYEDANDMEVELGEKCDDELEELEANGITVAGTTYEVHCHDH